jgi:hypothetical protein
VLSSPIPTASRASNRHVLLTCVLIGIVAALIIGAVADVGMFIAFVDASVDIGSSLVALAY